MSHPDLRCEFDAQSEHGRDTIGDGVCIDFVRRADWTVSLIDNAFVVGLEFSLIVN
jgi:hypothetical protein